MALAQTGTRSRQTALAQQGAGRGGPSGLADVLDVLLDKGLVIDAFVRVSLVGIELLTIDARVVVASVDTYLRFAEAVNRLDLLQARNAQSLGDLGGGSKALSSRGPRAGSPDRTEQRPRDDEPKAEGEPDAQEEPEPQAPREPEEEAQDDKRILTRIKERGQVF